MRVDETNIDIIRCFRHGRKPFDEIAKELAITPNTVRARVKRLMADGVLDIIGVIDPEKLENHFLDIVGVKLKNMNLVKKGRNSKN